MTQSPAAPPVTSPAYPGIRDPGIRDPRTTEKPVARNTPKYVPAKPVVFHAAFFEAKSNLTRETLNALTAAAGQAVQLNKPVNIRIVALGARETDENLWRRRLYAVKDELVRLGVPFDRIRSEGAGPFIVMIKPNEPPRPRSARQRLTYDLDSIDDPLSNN